MEAGLKLQPELCLLRNGHGNAQLCRHIVTAPQAPSGCGVFATLFCAGWEPFRRIRANLSLQKTSDVGYAVTKSVPQRVPSFLLGSG